MSLEAFAPEPGMTDMEIYRLFLDAVGQAPDAPVPLARSGHCYEVPAMGVYFDDDGDLIVAHVHD